MRTPTKVTFRVLSVAAGYRLRRAIEGLRGRDDWEIVVAPTLDAAREHMRRRTWSAVLLDLTRAGSERMLRRARRSLPAGQPGVIAVVSDHERVEEALDHGADRVLVAPDMAELGRTLREQYGTWCRSRMALDASAHAAEERYRAMVEAAADAILVADLESGQFVDANAAAIAMLGYSLVQLRQLTSRQLSPPSEQGALDAVEAELLAVGRAFAPRLRLAGKNGEIVSVSLAVRAYELAGRELYIAVIRDVTDEVARERELETSNRQLREAQEHLIRGARLAAVGELAAGVAHEINNPAQFVKLNLSSARAQIEALRRPGIEEAIDALAEMLGDSLDGIGRIQGITRDLLPFVRAEAQELEATDINAVIERAARMARNVVRQRAELVMELEPVPATLAHPAKLTQVVTNLLVNAAHAIDEGVAERHEIRVRSGCDGKQLRVAVQDTGCGIPDSIRERIFDPFFTTKGDSNGTGLGLSLCAQVVRDHGGTIECSSTEGQGTTFEIRLPLAAPRMVDARARAQASQVAERRERRASLPSGARVLVIDDEPLVLKALQRALTRRWRVEVALGGEEALAVLQSDRGFDVIMCDLMMPVIDGPAVYQSLTDRWPALAERMVFCSGGAFTPRARTFVDTVRNPVLYKPLSPSDLDLAVAEVVSRLGTLAGA